MTRRGKRMIGIGIGVAAVAVLGVWGAFIYNVKTVERPDYRVVQREGDIEVRDYPPLVVAEVGTRGTRWEAVSRGFAPLARYIFAKERGGDPIPMTAPVTQTREPEKIAMTAPVTQTERGDGSWTIRFIMPSSYDLASLPQPASNVTLDELPARRVAAIRFSGWATDSSIAENETRLRDWLSEHDLEPEGPATYAYYDDPWMPGPLRRNEVLLSVGGR